MCRFLYQTLFLLLVKNVQRKRIVHYFGQTFKLSCRPQLNVQVLFTMMRMWFKPDFRRYCCDLLLCSYREYESDLRSNEHYLSSSEIYDFHIFTVIYVHTVLSYYLFRGK